MPRNQVTDRDRGYRKLVRELGDTGRLAVTVGIHEREGAQAHPSGGSLSIAEIAAVHEFGAGPVPRRSFLQDTIDQHRSEIEREMAKLGRLVARRRLTAEKALEVLGEYLVALIQERIRDHIPPPLAGSTIARKGSSTPLIDTGELLKSIRAEVVELAGETFAEAAE